MKYLLTLSLLCCVSLASAQQPQSKSPNEQMILRSYVLLSKANHHDCFPNETENPSAESEPTLKEIFSELGVPCPKGSYIKYNREEGELSAFNTRKNLFILEDVLYKLSVIPYQIEIELKFVSFELSEISKLGPDGINKESLATLWTNGIGKLLAAPKILTQSGQRATTKGCTECIYPTEYTTIEAKGPEPHPSAFEPGSFETREIGAILDVLAEVSPSGNLINITICPELVLPPTWEDYGIKYTDKNGIINELPIRLPFFHSYSIQTNIFLENGHTALIGGGMPSPDGQHLVYAFLTARLIGIRGERLYTE